MIEYSSKYNYKGSVPVQTPFY